MKRSLYLAGVATAFLLAAEPAAAQVRPSEFSRCDGYGVPTRGGDAMTRGAGAIGVSNARTSAQLRRSPVTLGPAGIESCTAALADPRLEAEHGLRRASLLHARALHRLAGDGTAAALEDLALAEQAAAGAGPLAARSFGLSLRLTRAFALLKSGHAEEVAAISDAVIAERPYDPNLRFAAARLHFAATHDWSAYVARAQALAAVDPNLISSLFALAIARGEYADAIALHPQIVMTMPRARGAYVISGVDDIAAEQVVARAWFDGALAYALQVEGQGTRADAVLASAMRDVEAALAPPPPRSETRGPGREARERHAAMERRREEAVGSLAVWERHVRLRRQLDSGHADEVLAELQRAPVPMDTAGADLIEQLMRAQPSLRAEGAPRLEAARANIYSVIDHAMLLGVSDLLERMPEPESPQRLPDYRPTDDSFRIRPSAAYRSTSGPLAGVQTVRFSSTRGSMAVANEMALLRAAQLARDSGSRGMIVIARRGVIRTMNTTGWLSVPLSVPTGQEVELDVLLVDPANLPADYREARWRVLDPGAIWAALSPVYPVTAPVSAP